MAREVSPLSRQIKPTGHPVLTTVEQTCDYMLSLPKRVAMLTNAHPDRRGGKGIADEAHWSQNYLAVVRQSGTRRSQ
jgi:hypothetical protein